MTIINSPHDHFFKSAMRNLQTARAFLQAHFPARWLKFCDLDTLKIESESFIDADLRGYCSDVLLSVRIRDGGKGYIYWLLEHQSTPDWLMAFRLHHYAIAVMYRHVQLYKQRPPLVIPVLFYTGQQTPYPYTLNWLDCFDNPQLAAEIYTNPFPLINVQDIPDDAIEQHGPAALMEYFFKNVAAKTELDNIASHVNGLIAESRHRGYTTDDDVLLALTYLVQTGTISNYKRFLAQVVGQLPKVQGEKIMNLAMTIEERGKLEGIQEGKLEGKQEVARKMFMSGMTEETIKQLTGLSAKELKAIRP